jgi:hypothetical protein
MKNQLTWWGPRQSSGGACHGPPGRRIVETCRLYPDGSRSSLSCISTKHICAGIEPFSMCLTYLLHRTSQVCSGGGGLQLKPLKGKIWKGNAKREQTGTKKGRKRTDKGNMEITRVIYMQKKQKNEWLLNISTSGEEEKKLSFSGVGWGIWVSKWSLLYICRIDPPGTKVVTASPTNNNVWECRFTDIKMKPTGANTEIFQTKMPIVVSGV